VRGFSEKRSPKLFARGWLLTAILISASHVARIIGVSHWLTYIQSLKLIISLNVQRIDKMIYC
jgi:hypothetical protein